MKNSLAQIDEPEPMPASAEKTALVVSRSSAIAARPRGRILFAVPAASLIALAVHLFVSHNEPAPDTRSYSVFLGIMLGASLVAASVQLFWSSLRRWMAHMCPIIAAAVLGLCAWEVITSGFRLLPLPYFPGPAAVLQN